MDEIEKDWKLKLRQEKLITPFQHFAVVADGIVRRIVEGFECKPGRAWMAMKTWATNPDEAIDMIQIIGNQIGFSVDGHVMVYDTEPEQPPGNTPHGYDIQFTPYDKKA